jgi:G3E family GTPase
VSGGGPDFIVLTGFLGSGKTTLLRDFLAGGAASDTAIIVNEVGEIGLDAVILRESGDTQVAMLSNGCICCQSGSDLAYTIDRLLATDRPGYPAPLRRIVLETSGLAKPGPVLRQLASLAPYRLRASVLATFDATRGVSTASFEEAAAQWAAAHRIVITKTDAVPTEALERARDGIAAINPLAEIVASADRDRAVAAAFAPLAGIAPTPAPPRDPGRMAHPRIAVRLARPTAVLAYNDVASWLDNLAGALGERLLRLKGLVQVKECDRAVLVQSVGTAFSAPRPIGEPAMTLPLFLVIIARDLQQGELEAIAPTGLFAHSSWTEPGALGRSNPLSPISLGWY